MNEIITENGAHAFYLPYQIIASAILAVAGWLVGSILAWIIWGRSKARVARMEKKNAELRASL